MPEPTEPVLDLKQIAAQLFARKWLILGAALLGGAIAFAYAIIPPNEYKTSAVIQIEKRRDGVTLPEELIGNLIVDGAQTGSSFSTEIHVIRSRLILEPVAQRLGLMNQASAKKLPAWGDFVVREEVFERVPSLKKYVPEAYAVSAQKIEIKEYSVSDELVGVPLKITSLGEGSYRIAAFGKSFEGMVGLPTSLDELGSIVVSSLEAEAGREFTIRKLPTRSIVARLSKGLQILERGGTGIIDFSYTGTDPETVVPILNAIISTYQAASLQRRSAEIDQSIAFISEQLPDIRSQLDTAQKALADFRSQNELVGELSLSTQNLLTRIVEHETALEELDYKIEEILKRVTPNHPDYQNLNEERSRISARLEEAKANLERVPKAEQNLALLTRDAARARGLEIQLSERVEQLRILKASAVGNVRVLEPAEVALLNGPNRTRPLLIGILAGFALASLVVLVRNFFRSGIEGAEDIEDLGLSLFATISAATAKDTPKHSMSPLVSREPDNPITEAFRGLRTGLQFSLASSQSKTVLITSTSPSEGKSFISQNLAAILASSEKKVLLIDADMRRGKLHRYFDKTTASEGLSEYLSGNATIEIVVQDTPVDGLDIISTGRRPPNPAELLERSQFGYLLKWAEKNYDAIVIDTPPVLAVADPIIAASQNVVTLLVVRHLQTTSPEALGAVKSMENAGIKLSGAILNAYDRKRGKYGHYGYKYGYTYGGYGYNYSSDRGE